MNRTVETTSTGETALILAAERLFAEGGIEGVALRHINQAANHKNISAAHYHFGSREGLVQAVLAYRLPELDRRRGELLRRNVEAKDVRFYLEAFIAPLAEELAPREEGNYYLRFIQQYEKYQGDYEFARRISPWGVEIYAGLEKLLYYIPEEVRRLRIGHLINMIHSVLGTAEGRLEKGELSHGDIPLIAVNAVDMFAAGLSAPLSAETIRQLGSDRELDAPDNSSSLMRR
jgi:AcrR family transcriptional regulator